MGVRGYDGSITIDTKIDEKGFNKGIKNLGSKTKNLGRSIAAVMAGLTTGILVVLVIVTKIIKYISNMVKKVIEIGRRTGAVKNEFNNLKTSLTNAFLPLANLALPLLKSIAAWLTNVLNKIGMFFAALTGQTQVMQALSDSVSDASNSTSDLAQNTEDAEKAAKGALAAFDEINVLQQEDEKEPSGGGPSGGGDGFTMEPISQKILDFVNKVKGFFTPLWEAIVGFWDAVKGLGEAIWNVLGPMLTGLQDIGFFEFIRDVAIFAIRLLTKAFIGLTEWINNNQEAFQALLIMIGAAVATFALIWLSAHTVIAAIVGIIAVIGILIAKWPEISAAAKLAWEWIKGVWAAAGPWFINNVWQPLTTWAANTLNSIGEFFKKIWNSIKRVWQSIGPWFINNVWRPISDWASSVWTNISQWASEAWENIKSVWQAVTDWINTNIVDPIVTAFENAWENIRTAFETAFGAIVEFAKGIINSVIDLINGLINGVVSGMNAIINALNSISVSIPDWVPKIGGQTFGINLETITAPQIPKLATGAVIPPNSEFLAVLGDQRSGRNIETPEGLMRQIVREELASGGQEVTINFAGSLGALVKELKPYIDKENQRIGRSLVRGL